MFTTVMMAAFQFLRGLPFIAITFICLNVLYNFCRYTTHNSSCFYILCYNCSCCYNCSFTDGDTRTDGYVCTKPHLIFNAN